MKLITHQSKLSDIILQDPSTITVLDRFGIELGVGDTTVDQACASHALDIDFFLAILNTFINEGYFPQQAMSQFSAEKIVDYLRKTNDYYQHNVLPNIERHFGFLIAKAPSHNNNLVLMKQFFDEMKAELLQRIVTDNEQWFPEILKNGGYSSPVTFTSWQNTDATIEDKINDLINMLIVHLKGDYDHNLGYAVVVAVFSLKKDIKQNNRIRNRLLSPICNKTSQ